MIEGEVVKRTQERMLLEEGAMGHVISPTLPALMHR